jgi:thiamine biosynthesis lipoprotein
MNRSKAGESFELDSDTLEVLKKSLWTAQASDGAYDVTVWPLKTIWKKAKEAGILPSAEAIESALPKVGYQYILLDDSSGKASLSKEGVQIDLGGIGKGYAVEEAAKFLSKNGVRSGIVNAGGNLKLIGAAPTSAGWRVGIEHPRNLEGYSATILVENDMAVSTSGDYQDFFYHKNKRYSHILDPRTGYPVESGVVSVTIIAKDAFTADALDTAFFVMGPEKGFEMIEKLKDQGVEAIVIQELPGGKLSLAGSFGAMKLVQKVDL